jgi:hypothetical protein
MNGQRDATKPNAGVSSIQRIPRVEQWRTPFLDAIFRVLLGPANS